MACDHSDQVILGLNGIDILEKLKDIEVGFSIGTADEKIRKFLSLELLQSKKGFMPWMSFIQRGFRLLP